MVNTSSKQNTDERIVNSARLLFSKRGFDGTSMTDIARDVGIQKSSLYYFFESKEAIYFTVLNTVMREVAEMFQIDPRGSERKLFEDVVRRSIQKGIDEGAGMVDVMGVRHSSSKLLRIANQNFVHMRESITIFLDHCKVADPSFVAQILIDSNQMYLTRVASKQADISVNEYVKRLADIMLPSSKYVVSP